MSRRSYSAQISRRPSIVPGDTRRRLSYLVNASPTSRGLKASEPFTMLARPGSGRACNHRGVARRGFVHRFAIFRAFECRLAVVGIASLARVFHPFAEICPAVVADPIVGFAQGRERSPILQLHLVEGIRAGYVLLAVLVLHAMDAYPDQGVAALPTLADFIIHPVSLRGVRANEDHRHGGFVQLAIDPPLDRDIALALDLFPLSVVDEAVPLIVRKQVAVPDLTGAPSIFFEMEAEENSP